MYILYPTFPFSYVKNQDMVTECKKEKMSLSHTRQTLFLLEGYSYPVHTVLRSPTAAIN